MSESTSEAPTLVSSEPMTETDEPEADASPGEAPEPSADGEGTSAEAASDGAVDRAAEGAADEAAGEAENEAGESPAAEPEAPAGPGPGDALSDEELVAGVAALVFASPDPLSDGRLQNLLERPRAARVEAALAEIGRRLETSGLPLELRQIAGGWRLMTRPEAQETVARLVKARRADKLSPAGLETLAVIAYRQPVTKAEIEAIRGVQCGAMLRNLVDRGLARVTGRANVPGSPLQYGTTKEFLDRFGMGSLKDLPRDGELLKE